MIDLPKKEHDTLPQLEIPVRGLHKHKKGAYYNVLGVVRNATNSGHYELMVRYVPLERSENFPDEEFVRNLHEFYSAEEWPDGKTRPRFCPVKQGLDGNGSPLEELMIP